LAALLSKLQPKRLHRPADREPVYVEVSPLLGRNLAGIGRFAARLVEALVALTPLRLFNTVQGEHAESMRLSNALPSGSEIEVPCGDLPGADDDLARWARRLVLGRRRPHDAWLARRCAAVYTMLRPDRRHFRRELCLLHDFTPALMPAAHVAETREHFGTLFGHTAALCDKLVANSHSTWADAAWLCTMPPENVVVCHPGPTICVRQHASTETVCRRRNVILVVSTFEPRKNGPFLLRWFLRTRALPPKTELWWVGPNGWLLQRITRDQVMSGRDRLVKFLGVVSDRRLCELYRAAAFTIYPSLYEGFGFPVLDSLRHGTPVVSSFNSSLQEFVGEGVHYFDPCAPASLDAACRDVLASGPGGVHRRDLDLKYSWDTMARQILALCDT
jgi:glycosyltransferase involved in cell wall biosynthesis